MIVDAYTDDIFHPAPGSPANGHHYVTIFVNVSSYGVGSRLFYYLDGGLLGEDDDSITLQLPHSNCCDPGCGYEIKVEERASDGTTYIGEVTAPKVILCPSESLFSCQNPVVLTCSPVAGTNVPIQVQSVPVGPGYTIRAYLDGVQPYAAIASATTDGLGVATVIIPTAVNGQKYWFSEEISGRKESFFNSVVIGGGCQNMLLNESFVCGSGGGTVTFAPTGGSGDYSMSENNNDLSGYEALAPKFLPNGINQIYVRDNTNHAYKIMYSIDVDCVAPSAPSAPI